MIYDDDDGRIDNTLMSKKLIAVRILIYLNHHFLILLEREMIKVVKILYKMMLWINSQK